jgi:microcystin-dependent protein
MPAHNHSGTASTTNIYGTFYIRGNMIAATGVFKSENYSVGARQDVIGQKITLNANVLPTLTVANKGGSKAHNIIQPYISVYIWKRIS